MKILWFTWKDRRNPTSGGAEMVNEELAKRLVKDGHEVIFLVSNFVGALQEEMKDGFKIIRLGNKWSVYFEAYKYYKKNLQDWPDLVIDEINTIPFFAKFYVKQKNIIFIHQLCRKVWFYQMFFPFSVIGSILEFIYVRLLNDKKVVTISESTKKDLINFGFKEENISVISEGIQLKPIHDISIVNKFKDPTILSFGAVRPMKRTLDIVKAFEIAKENLKDLKLIIAGDILSTYGKKVVNNIRNSKYSSSIECLGKVDEMKKVELMQGSLLILVTSIKEGWGLVVTEANSQGTPALAYNVDGLCDAVKNGETGILCDENSPKDLAEKMTKILENHELYKTLQKNAWEWSKEINFENSYKQFLSKINE